jgi:hypothetical protein
MRSTSSTKRKHTALARRNFYYFLCVISRCRPSNLQSARSTHKHTKSRGFRDARDKESAARTQNAARKWIIYNSIIYDIKSSGKLQGCFFYIFCELIFRLLAEKASAIVYCHIDFCVIQCCACVWRRKRFYMTDSNELQWKKYFCLRNSCFCVNF